MSSNLLGAVDQDGSPLSHCPWGLGGREEKSGEADMHTNCCCMRDTCNYRGRYAASWDCCKGDRFLPGRVKAKEANLELNF